MELMGKKALVTGASRGIGKAIALELARRGADVAFSYQGTPEEGAAVVSEIRALGRRAESYIEDVSDWAGVERYVGDVLEKFDGLDFLVNNAGITADAVLWKMSEEQFDKVLAVNLKGAFNHIRAVTPHFRKRKFGRIVNISSINAKRGKFGQTNYCASKAGLLGLTKAAARELAAFGVLVNAVAPGAIETEMVAAMAEEAKAKARAEILLGEMGKPEDVAKTVAFLCG